MIGKALAIFLAVLALVMGGSMYYLQVYAYYEDVTLPSDALRLVPAGGGAARPIPVSGAEAIDANSSPLRFRACFDTSLTIAEARGSYTPAEAPVPLNAPFWFDCFDAKTIGEALEAGTAAAFLAQKNVAYGVDRYIALTGDGRGYAWHQLNNCGDLAYDGTQVGEDCPPRDDATPEEP